MRLGMFVTLSLHHKYCVTDAVYIFWGEKNCGDHVRIYTDSTHVQRPFKSEKVSRALGPLDGKDNNTLVVEVGEVS